MVSVPTMNGSCFTVRSQSRPHDGPVPKVPPVSEPMKVIEPSELLCQESLDSDTRPKVMTGLNGGGSCAYAAPAATMARTVVDFRPRRSARDSIGSLLIG